MTTPLAAKLSMNSKERLLQPKSKKISWSWEEESQKRRKRRKRQNQQLMLHFVWPLPPTLDEVPDADEAVGEVKDVDEVKDEAMDEEAVAVVEDAVLLVVEEVRDEAVAEDQRPLLSTLWMKTPFHHCRVWMGCCLSDDCSGNVFFSSSRKEPSIPSLYVC
mmetsp:Transcript_22947/g.66391  ORF Transcript_22947/g.66391 Transcript_22947/m.66391 type:complete len:161 (+) Transcript_22947:684-1166(+)